MRRPMSEETQVALAAALDWSVPEFESAISASSEVAPQRRAGERQIPSKTLAEVSRELAETAIRLQNIARTLQT
jgi:hypothetical protein